MNRDEKRSISTSVSMILALLVAVIALIISLVIVCICKREAGIGKIVIRPPKEESNQEIDNTDFDRETEFRSNMTS